MFIYYAFLWKGSGASHVSLRDFGVLIQFGGGRMSGHIIALFLACFFLSLSLFSFILLSRYLFVFLVSWLVRHDLSFCTLSSIGL